MSANEAKKILETIKEEITFSTIPDKNQQLIQIALGLALLANEERLTEIAEILQSIAKTFKPDEFVVFPEPIEETAPVRTKGRRKKNDDPAGAEITS